MNIFWILEVVLKSVLITAFSFTTYILDFDKYIDVRISYRFTINQVTYS